MQLLIVHRDAEIGEGLVGLIRDYSAHAADFVASDEAAEAWAEQHAECDLLLTQLEGEGVDGLALSGSLGEKFSGLTTFFLPAYSLFEQRLEVANTKIFPEPIDGERLRHVLARAQLDRFDGAVDGGVPGHQDDFAARKGAADLA